MVNREAREQAARALRRFLDCETTNEEFDREFVQVRPVWKRGPTSSKDRAIGAVYGFAWNLYDDFTEHKLEAEWELDEPVKEIAERCVLFLGSDCEYEWKKSEFIGIDWRRIFSRFLPWVKWEADTLKRFEANLGEPEGDASVWPFYRHEDYEASRRGPRLFRSVCGTAEAMPFENNATFFAKEILSFRSMGRGEKLVRMKTLRIAVSLTLLAVTSSLLPAQTQATPPTADSLHGWLAATSPEAFEAWTHQRLAAAKADVDKLVAVSGPRTVENTLRPFDDAQNELAIAGNNAYLLFSLADGATLRDKGQALSAVVSSAQTDLSLNQQVYKALAAIPTPADPATRHYLERTLLKYRLRGVDRDEATRKKLHALQDKITDLTLAFGRNVADGTLKVTAKPAELEGLPADYIAAHKPGADGTITLTTDEPDVAPVMAYAKSAALRARMYTAYHSRAYPKNEAVLHDLMATRQELASTLGYAHYADLATADQMIGSAANVEKLIGSLDEASRTFAAREYGQLLAFAQKQQPGLETITMAERGYWSELYRRSQFSFDAQSVRPYFPYAQVQDGILQVASRFFRVEFKAAKDAQVWDKSVDVFDVYDAAPGTAGRKLGRIYLDMHPREGKDKWFSSSPVIPGISGRQLPEAMLVCNFSGGKAGEPGLMQYDEVVTFFHEFGHLMHNILGGQGAWSGAGRFSVEGDFVESPSQMLEEVFHSATVLQTFGKHYQTGAVLPAELIARMNAASAYGRGQWIQRQLIYTSFSLGVHNQDPAKLDFDKEWSTDTKRYSSYPDLPGTHDFASFTHLTGYASNYYTYVLDKVIAIDFFAQFDRNNLLDGPVALRYRKTVLEPGATKPAAELVKDFLGRPQAMDAIRAWMGQEFEEPAK